MHVKFGPEIITGSPNSKFCENPVAPLLITLISALIELEYLVHQIDNGYDFEQLNGFEIVLGIIDSGLDNNLVKKSARVISAATQANSKGLNSSENSEKFIFLYF